MTSTADEKTETAPPRIGDYGEFTAGAFVVDPEVAETRIARKDLSPSTSNTFATKCTAQWAVLKLMPFDDSPTSPAGAGGLVHEAFENFYALDSQQRTSENLASEINRVASKAAEGDLATMKYLSAMYRELAWGIFDIEDPTKVEVHRVEEELHAEIDGVPAMGRIDRTDIVDGKLVLIDYKSSRKTPKPEYDDYDHAMRTYAMLYEQVYGERPVEAWLYYTKLGVAKKVDLSEAKLKATRRRISRSWKKHHTQVIEQSAFPTKVSPLCGWCPLVNLCPAAAEAGKSVSPKAQMTPYALKDHGLADPLEVLARSEASQALGGEVTAASFESPSADDADAGHLHGDRTPRSQTSRNVNTEESTTMRIDETVPYEKYTRAGDMNPSSWAVNNLFTLRAAVTEAIGAAVAEEEIDPEVNDVAELTEITFRDVALTVAAAQRDWLGVGPDTQAASFNRLTYVAKDFLSTRAADFTDEDSFSAYLDEMTEAMLAAVDSVHEVFNLIDDEAEAIASEDGEYQEASSPWRG